MIPILLINRFKPSHFVYQQQPILSLGQHIVLVNQFGVALPEAQTPWMATVQLELSDHQAVLAQLAPLIEQYGVRRVVVLSEFDVQLGAKIREQHQLPGMKCTQANWFLNKLAMKTQLQQGGVLVPDFVALGSFEQALAMLERHHKIVIKPVQGSGSVDTFIIDQPAQLDEVWQRVITSGKDFEVEAFIDGDMYHCDLLLQDGQLRLFSPSRYVNPTTEFSQAHYSASISELDEEKQSLLLAHCWACLDALQVEHGLFHLECFMTPAKQLVCCEIAARVPGAGVRPAIREGFGADITQWLIESQINPDMDVQFSQKHGFGQVILFNLSDWQWVQTRFSQLQFDWLVVKQMMATSASVHQQAQHSSDAAIKFVFLADDETLLLARLALLIEHFDHQG